MQPHEYSIIGHSRATIGRYLGTLAGLLASTTAIVATGMFDLAVRFGWAEQKIGFILFPLNATLFYFIGHFAFDNWIWKLKKAQALLGIPDLNGEWECIGKTLNTNGGVDYNWQGTITITQTWEKIRVYMKTASSSSRSQSASLVKEPGRGYVLMFSYKNDPRIGEPELKSHVGYCELELNESLTEADGDYFNNKGRVTFGRIHLKRKEAQNG